jgi:hypothetical protein
MFRGVLLMTAGVFLVPACLDRAAAQPPVSLELVTEQGFPIDGHQRWMEFLQDIGFSTLRIRGARPDDEPRIENRGTPAAPRYMVTGVLVKGNVMRLPGAAFRIGQRKQLEEWLRRLQVGGDEAVLGETGPFGLLQRQWTTLRETLSRKVTWETKDRPVSEVVEEFAANLPIALEVDSSAQRVLSGRAVVAESWRGISCGTALAGIVRPVGLVVVPAGQGTPTVSLLITPSTSAGETWPVGTSAQPPFDRLAPALFRYIQVEIHDRPLSEPIRAIQERVEIPFFFDHFQLARHQVDLETKVNFKPRKTFYKKIVDDLLFQARLRNELRLDETGEPFLWITTIKQ